MVCVVGLCVHAVVVCQERVIDSVEEPEREGGREGEDKCICTCIDLFRDCVRMRCMNLQVK